MKVNVAKCHQISDLVPTKPVFCLLLQQVHTPGIHLKCDVLFQFTFSSYALPCSEPVIKYDLHGVHQVLRPH